jgi:hypothetical protein
LKASSADYKEEVNRRWISFVSKQQDNSQSTCQPPPKAWKSYFRNTHRFLFKVVVCFFAPIFVRKIQMDFCGIGIPIKVPLKLTVLVYYSPYSFVQII